MAASFDEEGAAGANDGTGGESAAAHTAYHGLNEGETITLRLKSGRGAQRSAKIASAAAQTGIKGMGGGLLAPPPPPRPAQTKVAAAAAAGVASGADEEEDDDWGEFTT